MIRTKRVLAAVIETTAYTAATTFANSDAAFNAYDVKIEPGIEMNERPRQGSFGHLTDVVGMQMGTATFKVDMHGDGSGGVPLWASRFLPACGWTDDGLGVFTPKTQAPDDAGADVKTVTIRSYEDGGIKSIKGAMGSWRIPVSSGKMLQMEFTFIGAWVPYAAGSLLTPTYPTQLPLRMPGSGTGVTYDGTQFCFETCTIDSGNTVDPRPCQGESSGYKGAIVSQRVPTIQMNPEAGTAAQHVTKQTDWLASNTQAFAANAQLGEDILDIAAASTQIINMPEGDRAGLVTDELSLKCIGSSPLSITFSAA